MTLLEWLLLYLLPELPPWLRIFSPPPSCGCVVLLVLFHQYKPHGHAVIVPFLRSLFSTGLEASVLHVSVYHLFGSLWIIQKSVLHYHTLSLLLLHFLSLYLSNHCPPTHLSLSGPHCGVVAVLKYRALFSWCSSQGCVIPSTSVSLGHLISRISFWIKLLSFKVAVKV